MPVWPVLPLAWYRSAVSGPEPPSTATKGCWRKYAQIARPLRRPIARPFALTNQSTSCISAWGSSVSSAIIFRMTSTARSCFFRFKQHFRLTPLQCQNDHAVGIGGRFIQRCQFVVHQLGPLGEGLLRVGVELQIGSQPPRRRSCAAAQGVFDGFSSLAAIRFPRDRPTSSPESAGRLVSRPQAISRNAPGGTAAPSPHRRAA